MIVKNEGRIIERCLDSILDIADKAIIIDTGSTDNTVQTIMKWGRKHSYPVHVVEKPWVDFAHNRTELVAHARDYCQSEGYLLLLDADHIVHGDFSGIDRADSYMVRMTGEAVEYRMPYLVKANIPWRYVSRTHEYLTSDVSVSTQENIDSFYIEHRCDGGTRIEKFDRDLKFLEEDYAENPDNARTVFYLAETYKNSDRKDEAVKLYRERLSLGGWDEERYMAALEMARITGDTDDFMTAWDICPGRWEAPYHLVKKFNEALNRTAAYAIAAMAQRKLTTDHSLFIDKWIMDYGFAFEAAIALWWAGHKDEANDVFRALIESNDTPENYKEACRNNLTFD